MPSSSTSADAPPTSTLVADGHAIAHATTIEEQPPLASADVLARPTAADAGTSCATGYEASDLDRWFSAPHGELYGADYQRAFKLPDGRVLWMFQDAMIRTSGGALKLTHNVGLIQSGTCFTLLRAGTAAAPRPWIMWDRTVDMRTWYWPLGGEADPDGQTFHLLMAEMHEHSTGYLQNTTPTATYLVDVRLSDMAVTGYRPAPNAGTELYGFSLTSDATWTYLYSNCYLQFGQGFLGHNACTATSKLARVPRGQLGVTPSYWNGSGWVADPNAAMPVVSQATTGDGINAAQVMWDGAQYRLIDKVGDWFGDHIVEQTAPNPWGPWTTIADHPEVKRCSRAPACNTYFASWVPWRNDDGTLIYAISNNRWDGVASPVYRPSFDRAG